MWGFGRAIALWGFNAAQQFRGDFGIDLCRACSDYRRERGSKGFCLSLPELGCSVGWGYLSSFNDKHRFVVDHVRFIVLTKPLIWLYRVIQQHIADLLRWLTVVFAHDRFH